MTNVTPAETPDQPDGRARGLADFRTFIDFLACNPWAPMPYLTMQADLQANAADIWNGGADGVAELRRIADGLGEKPNESLDDRTQVKCQFGAVEYRVISWHRRGRPDEPVARDARDVELERLRAEVAALQAAAAPSPGAEHNDAGGWKGAGPGSCGVECSCGVTFDGFDTLNEAHEQLARHIETANADPSGLGYSREADDPTPVSPARGLTVGAPLSRIAEDGHKLVDETVSDLPSPACGHAACQPGGDLYGITHRTEAS